ncbi:MAG: hypothetical protein EXQ58_13075 [Acidobacteria bacterium]|nr:hypothetical protein [Acidobacteriota bacterium]
MHLCANIPNFQILETFEDYDVPWRCKLTPGTPRVKDGFYELPTDPGWELDVDEKLIAGHPENTDAKLNRFKSSWEQQMCKQQERLFTHSEEIHPPQRTVLPEATSSAWPRIAATAARDSWTPLTLPGKLMMRVL